jgi:hypothetical protein
VRGGLGGNPAGTDNLDRRNDMDKYHVTYSGLLQGIIVREFDSLERAVQWARQAGVYEYANINKVEAEKQVQKDTA